MVKQGANVVNKQRIELLGDLFLVGKIERAIKGNPYTFEVHGPNLDNMSSLLTLQDAISAASGHASNIEKLGAVDHVIV